MPWVEHISGVIEKDIYDKRLYDGIKAASEKLADVEEKNKEKLPTVDVLLEDIWAGLYKASPKHIKDVPPSLRLNEILLMEAENSQDWQNLRDTTMLDEWAAALGSAVIGQKVIEAMPDDVKERLKDAIESEQLAQRLLNEADFALEGAGLTKDGIKKKELEAKAAALKDEALKILAGAEGKAAEAVGRIKKEVREAAKEGARWADELIENAGAFVYSYGTAPGRATSIESRRKFDAALQIARNPYLKKISEMAGRMINIAERKQRTKPNHEPQEVTGITTGKNITHLLASELANLAHPVLKKEFYRKFSEGSLLQYELKGKEAEGRGPVIACLDTSGSMEGEKDMWAKAVMLALFAIARRQKRAFCCIHFGARSEQKTFKFPNPEQVAPKDLIEAASFFFGGGTNFEAPLKSALSVMEESPYKKGDIIFITDGQAPLAEKFITEFKRKKAVKQFNVISVLMPDGQKKPLDAISDIIVRTEPQAGKDGEALEIMFSI